MKGAQLINSRLEVFDAWINIPQLASDNYILHLARLLFSNLSIRSHIYLALAEVPDGH